MAAFPLPPEQRAIRRVTNLYDLPIRTVFLGAVDLARAAFELQALTALVTNGPAYANQLRLVTGVDTLVGRLAVDLGPLFEEMITRGAIVGEEVFADALGVAPVDISTFRRLAQQVSREQIGELIQGIEHGWTDPLTREHVPGQIDVVQRLIDEGFAEGRSPSQTAKLIEDVIGLDDRRAGALVKYRDELVADGVEGEELDKLVEKERAVKIKSRALAISRTETIRAASEAQDLIWEEAVKQGQIDDIYEMVWIASPRSCPVCRGLHLSRAPIGGEFPEPGGKGPPAPHPHCSCGRRLERKKTAARAA